MVQLNMLISMLQNLLFVIANKNSLFVVTTKRINKSEVLVTETTTFRQGLLAKGDSKIIIDSINNTLQLPSWRIKILIQDIKVLAFFFF